MGQCLNRVDDGVQDGVVVELFDRIHAHTYRTHDDGFDEQDEDGHGDEDDFDDIVDVDEFATDVLRTLALGVHQISKVDNSNDHKHDCGSTDYGADHHVRHGSDFAKQVANGGSGEYHGDKEVKYQENGIIFNKGAIFTLRTSAPCFLDLVDVCVGQQHEEDSDKAKGHDQKVNKVHFYMFYDMPRKKSEQKISVFIRI